MIRTNRKLTLFAMGILLPALLLSFVPPSSKNKKKYTGNYHNMGNMYHPSDTVTSSLFMTTDSFAMIYQVQADSDYRLPLLQGSWNITNDTLLELTDGINKWEAVFNPHDYGTKSLKVNGHIFIFQRRVY